MSHNARGGKNYKKRGKGNVIVRGPLRTKQDREEYGIVEKELGDCKVDVKCSDGLNRIGKIPGSFRKKIWIKVGDMVLVSIREFEEKKCDIITKYEPDDVRTLKKEGVTLECKSIEDINFNEEETGFDFDNI